MARTRSLRYTGNAVNLILGHEIRGLDKFGKTSANACIEKTLLNDIKSPRNMKISERKEINWAPLSTARLASCGTRTWARELNFSRVTCCSRGDSDSPPTRNMYCTSAEANRKYYSHKESYNKVQVQLVKIFWIRLKRIMSLLHRLCKGQSQHLMHGQR